MKKGINLNSQETMHQGGSPTTITEIEIIIILQVIMIIMIVNIIVMIITALIRIIIIMTILIILVKVTTIMIAVTVITIIMQAMDMTITNPQKRDLTDKITWREISLHPVGIDLNLTLAKEVDVMKVKVAKLDFLDFFLPTCIAF